MYSGISSACAIFVGSSYSCSEKKRELPRRGSGGRCILLKVLSVNSAPPRALISQHATSVISRLHSFLLRKAKTLSFAKRDLAASF